MFEGIRNKPGAGQKSMTSKSEAPTNHKKLTEWVGEMASVTSMIADGMTKDSLKQGDTVTVIAFPSKNAGSTEALIKKITKADGTIVVDNSRAPNLRQP